MKKRKTMCFWFRHKKLQMLFTNVRFIWKSSAYAAGVFCVFAFLQAGFGGIEILASQWETSSKTLVASASRSAEKPASVNDLWQKKYNEYVNEEKARSTPTATPTEPPSKDVLPYVYVPPVRISTPVPTPTVTNSPAPSPTPTVRRTYGTLLKNVYISSLTDSGLTVQFVVDNSVVRSDTTIVLEYGRSSQSQSLTGIYRLSGDMYSTVYEARIYEPTSSYYYLYISLRDYWGNIEYASIPVTNSYGNPYPTYYPYNYNPDYYGYYGYNNVWSPFTPITAAPTASPTATPTAEPTATATPTETPTEVPIEEPAT